MKQKSVATHIVDISQSWALVRTLVSCGTLLALSLALPLIDNQWRAMQLAVMADSLCLSQIISFGA